jgi:hypothetical protein
MKIPLMSVSIASAIARAKFEMDSYGAIAAHEMKWEAARQMACCYGKPMRVHQACETFKQLHMRNWRGYSCAVGAYRVPSRELRRSRRLTMVRRDVHCEYESRTNTHRG